MSAYTDAVERNTEGLKALSTGICPGCRKCASDLGYDPDHKGSMECFQADWESGEAYSEPSFSASGCDICGSNLAGDLEVYHWVSEDGIEHGFGACVDCVLYLANGDEPENWEG